MTNRAIQLFNQLRPVSVGFDNVFDHFERMFEDDFITKNNLTKSTMKLIFDDKEFKELLSNLKIEKTVSGGSVANSIVGLSQLGNEVGFIGKVNDDELGGKYEDGLKQENVKYFYSKKKENLLLYC